MIDLNKVTIRVAETQLERMIAQQIEYGIFLRAGYTLKNLEETVLEYQPYNDASVFFVAYVDGSPHGVLRLINNGQFGLPSINNFDYGQDFRGDSSTVEIGTIAVERKAAGIARYLYKAAWQYSARKGHKRWVAAIDQGVWNALTKKFHFMLKAVSPGAVYMGSVTVPTIMDLAEQAQYMSTTHPNEWAFYSLEDSG